MEGVSEENNEIYLELTSENLFRALKTAQNARSLKVKLTNKHFPCLTVSVELVRGEQRATRTSQNPGGHWAGGRYCHGERRAGAFLGSPRQASASNSSRMVTHDIPVKVIPRKLWKNLQEPTVPDSDVSGARVPWLVPSEVASLNSPIPAIAFQCVLRDGGVVRKVTVWSGGVQDGRSSSALGDFHTDPKWGCGGTGTPCSH